jgi:hypothetical protein
LIWRLEDPETVIGLLALENVTRSFVSEAFELTANVLIGVEDPIPTRPLDAILNQLVPDDEATVRILSVSPA